MNICAVTLSGHIVRLEPLSEVHVPDLAIAGQDKSIWYYLPYGEITSKEKMQEFVKTLLKRQKEGTDLPFAVIHLVSGRAIGCTRYLEIRPQHRGLEIGGTWYGLAYQGAGVNIECKYLLLQHAFENLGCIRVQFKTDTRNVHSQHAIEKLGAVKEGIFRNHIVMPDGTLRHSIYYSILDTEWPSVKDKLEKSLSQFNLRE